ncbi:MAG: ankyrin repeat domain-containing protein [Victivallaceae bacterium]
MVKSGANIKVTDDEGNNALFLSNNLGKVMFFVYNGLDVNAQTKDAMIPLEYACAEGSQEMVTALINFGANINHQNILGGTPLNWAVVNGHYQIVRILLERGANVNLVDIYGNTALDSALRKKHEKIVALLEAYGAKSGKDILCANGKLF